MEDHSFAKILEKDQIVVEHGKGSRVEGFKRDTSLFGVSETTMSEANSEKE